VDAADAARREDVDPRCTGRDHRRRHGRCRPAARGERGGERRAGRLPDRALGRRGERDEVALREAHEQLPVPDRHGGRHRARLAHGRLGRRRDLEVRREREAVADQRRLEGDDRPAAGDRVGDLG
jgi:hypothetical protein